MKLSIFACILMLGGVASYSAAQSPQVAAQADKVRADGALNAAKKAGIKFIEEEQRQNISRDVKSMQKELVKEPSPRPQEESSQTPAKTTEPLSPVDKTKRSDAIMPPEPPTFLFDDATKEKYLATMREYYAYHTSGYQYRHRVFEWQLLSSKITFVVVIVLVLAGIYFSWVQFRSSLKSPYKAAVAEKDEKGEDLSIAKETTELEASFSGIKISSPILGVIILIISFLFFYLYLVHIYPISEIF